jgi:hypothetical protein
MNRTAGEAGPSAVLLEAVRVAVESGLEILREQPRLVPMAILSCGGEYSLLAFEGLDEAGIAAALRKRLRTAVPRPDAYVLRYRGELTRDPGDVADAIVVEGATPEMTQAQMWGYPLGAQFGNDFPCLGPCESYYAVSPAEPAVPPDPRRQ